MATRFGFGFVCWFSLLAAGETPMVGDLAPLAQLGAVGILAGVCWRLFGTIDKLADRWDAWEKTRHEDHETLNHTLAEMRENCAAVMAFKESHKNG